MQRIRVPLLFLALVPGGLLLSGCSTGDDAAPASEVEDDASVAEAPPSPDTAEAPGEDDADSLPPADPAITREALEHHVRFLASDEMRGRRPGSEEMGRVRDYVVRSLERSGVRPAGDDGTYLQRIPLSRWHHSQVPELVLETTEGDEIFAVFGVDFDVKLGGYGPPISRGRLRLRAVRAEEDLPETVPDDEAIWVQAGGDKVKDWLSAKGYRVRDWPVQLHLRSPLVGKEKAPPPATIEFDDPEMNPGVWLSLKGEIREVVSAGRVAAIDLRFFATKEEVEAYNVVGIIDGQGAPNRTEAIVLSAHMDGYGVLPGFDPDRRQGRDLIRNSADDDASGMAALLEVAEALAADEARPRAVVVLFTDLGTDGRKGGWWYVEHPAVPLERTVLNLHLDTLGRPDLEKGKPGRLWVGGSEMTNLQSAWYRLDLQVAQDMRPKYNYFQSRGSWVFASHHIPAHPLTSYGDHGDVYSFRDNPDRIDFDHLTAVTKTCLAATVYVADRTVDPAWQ